MNILFYNRIIVIIDVVIRQDSGRATLFETDGQREIPHRRAMQQTKRRPEEHCTHGMKLVPNISFLGGRGEQMVNDFIGTYRYLRARVCAGVLRTGILHYTCKGRYSGRHESTVMKMTKRAAAAVVPASQRLTRKIVIGKEHNIVIYVYCGKEATISKRRP